MFEVIPSEDFNKYYIERHNKLKHKDILPVAPLACLFVGRKGTGKTSSLYSLIKNGYEGSKTFDLVVGFFGSKDGNKVWKNMNSKKMRVEVKNNFDEFEFLEFIHELEKKQIKRLEKKLRPISVCVIVDDFASDTFFRGRPIQKALLNSRHYGLSIFISTQKLKMAPPVIRANVDMFLITSLTPIELKTFAEENSSLTHSVKDIYNYYKKVKDKGKYNFLVVNFKNDEKQRFRNGIDGEFLGEE